MKRPAVFPVPMMFPTDLANFWVLAFALAGVCALLAGFVVVFIGYFGKAGALMMASIVFSIGLGVLIVSLALLLRYWWVSVPIIALGVHGIRVWKRAESARQATFGLDSVVLVVVMISLTLAGFTALRRNIAHNQRVAIELSDMGFEVFHSFDGIVTDIQANEMSREQLDLAAKKMGSLLQLRNIYFQHCQCSSELLASLQHLRHVDNLGLQGCELPKDWPDQLVRFTSLRRLDIMTTQLADDDQASIEKLSEIETLEQIDLSSERFSVEVLEQIRKAIPQAEIP